MEQAADALPGVSKRAEPPAGAAVAVALGKAGKKASLTRKGLTDFSVP